MQKMLGLIGPFASSAIALALLLPSVFATAAKAADQSPVAQPGYVMPETEVFDLPDEGREPYRIFISKPDGPAPKDGFPVLYVLDGNAMFAGFAEVRRIFAYESNSRINKSIIVGVGYPTDKPYDTVRRADDYTSPVTAPASGDAKIPPGGRDHFLNFLLDKLRPEIARRYSINPQRQALFGHSYGGLFALHVLYTRPTAFSAIIAASSSQGVNNQAVLAEERAFTTKLMQSKIDGQVADLLLLVGTAEGPRDIWDAELLAQRLPPLAAYGFRSQFEKMDGEVHIGVPSRGITRILRFAFESAPFYTRR